MTEQELIKRITNLKQELKETRDILYKLKQSKKKPKFELSPTQIEVLEGKGYKIN